MKYLRHYLILLFLGFSFITKAQIVTLICNGEGATKDEATLNALRNALEQTYGTFVSSNTVIVNDKLIKDEIISLGRGNIQNYKVLDFYDGAKKKNITLQATVSVSKLVSYAKNNGASCELAGGAFVNNLRLNKLYLANAKKAFEQIDSIVETAKHKLYNFNISVDAPILNTIRNRINHTNKTTSEEVAMVNIRVTYSDNSNQDSLQNRVQPIIDALAQTVRTLQENDVKGSSFLDDFYKLFENTKSSIDTKYELGKYCFCICDNMGNRVIPIFSNPPPRLPSPNSNWIDTGIYYKNFTRDLCALFKCSKNLRIKKNKYRNLKEKTVTSTPENAIDLSLVYSINDIEQLSNIRVEPYKPQNIYINW